MRNCLVYAALALAALAGTSAHALTFSLAGLDLEPTGGLTVLSIDNADSSPIGSISFDFTYRANSPSWTEELAIQIEHVPSGATLRAGTVGGTEDYCMNLFGATCDVDLGAPLGTSLPFITSSTFGFSVADGSGLWIVSVGDGFNDSVVPDGVFDDGSRIEINTAVVPLPAAAWLFGSALLGLAGLRRRTG